MKSKYAKESHDNYIISATSNKQVKDTSSLRVELVRYALQFKGNPYAWGGTSLTKGADCSGFIQAVYKSKGITIPRTSKMQAKEGKTISLSKLKPGDLIFYGKDNEINHVALYIGNNKVIHASNSKYGIKISKFDYRKPYKAVNYIDQA